jgi:hypothetical protein
MDKATQDNLYLLQETLNGVLLSGADEVRRRDISMWFFPDDPSPGFEIVKKWETEGFLTILRDPAEAKEKDVCLKLLKPIVDIVPDKMKD